MFATNAIMAAMKGVVLFVEIPVSPMPTIAVNAFSRKKIETDVRKL
jgi:hypothetical protein